jgi:hypothetical protein
MSLKTQTFAIRLVRGVRSCRGEDGVYGIGVCALDRRWRGGDLLEWQAERMPPTMFVNRATIQDAVNRISINHDENCTFHARET